MNKILLLMVLSILSITFITAFFVTGCGDDGVIQGSTPTPSTTATPFKTTIPMPDYPLNIKAEGGDTSLFSIGIGLIMDGLKEGVTVTIAENTTGRVFDIIGNKFGIGAGQENRELSDTLKSMDQKMDMMISQLTSIEGQLSALSTQVSLSTKDIENHIDSTALQTYISNIETAFSTTSTIGYKYYSQAGSNLDPNTDPNSPAMEELKQDIQDYINSNYGKMEDNISHIRGEICPSVSGLDGALKDYTDTIILKDKNSKVWDPNNAMYTYLLLETYFAQILNYQTKACIIAMDIYNYKDPNGTLQVASSYLNGTYKDTLNDEIEAYLNTVNYLVVNLIDYRNINNYSKDAPNMYSTGLVHDDVYLMVLARARFFCAQIMASYGDTSGLYGTIITPSNYTPDSTNPAKSVTLQFSGPATATKTINAQNIAGQYPYTQWYKDGNSVIHCSSDNNWSCYDFSSGDPNLMYVSIDPNLPGGTYQVTLVDNGNKNSPWYHSITNLGQVTIKYYDPNNPNPNTATTSPTETNTFKFGYFSSRWYWGYNKINLSPMSEWTVPSKHDVYYYQDTSSHDNPTHIDIDDDYEISPLAGTSVFPVNSISLSGSIFDVTGSDYLKPAIAYQLQKIFIADSDDANSVISGKIYYYNDRDIECDSIGDNGNWNIHSSANCYYKLKDLDNSKEHDIVPPYTKYVDEPGDIDEQNTPQGIADIDIYKNHRSQIIIDLGCTQTSMKTQDKHGFSGDASTNWNMHVVYTKTYTEIFD